VIAAKLSSETFKPKLFGDVAVLQRKWHAALRPGIALPRYEDVMMGSLGRLADHIALLKAQGASIEVSRSGRYIQTWLGEDAWGIPLDALQPDCATALAEATRCALQNNQRYLAVAHCVRDGLVRTYDVLALPTSSRWGGTLIGAYVNERGSHYNLLDAVFASTDEGILSLAAIRDPDGQPYDFQIVHLNQGASRLLKVPSSELQWRRLGVGGHPLCLPAVTDRLLNVVRSGIGDQFEIAGEDRSLRLSATGFCDLVSLTISDVTALKKREESFRLLFDGNPMPMWVFDAQTKDFLSVNDAAVQHYGYDRATFLSQKLWDIWPPDEREAHIQALLQVGDAYHSGQHWRHVKADGSEIQVLTFGRRVAFDDHDGFLVAIVDITERRKVEARVAHMAHHDGLTELPNRVLYQQRLRQALEQSGPAEHVAVLCIDLDLFKNVNDCFGHPMGTGC
jgi:PAS domain S-box-containing protein